MKQRRKKKADSASRSQIPRGAGPAEIAEAAESDECLAAMVKYFGKSFSVGKMRFVMDMRSKGYGKGEMLAALSALMSAGLVVATKDCLNAADAGKSLAAAAELLKSGGGKCCGRALRTG